MLYHGYKYWIYKFTHNTCSNVQCHIMLLSIKMQQQRKGIHIYFQHSITFQLIIYYILFHSSWPSTKKIIQSLPIEFIFELEQYKRCNITIIQSYKWSLEVHNDSFVSGWLEFIKDNLIHSCGKILLRHMETWNFI